MSKFDDSKFRILPRGRNGRYFKWTGTSFQNKQELMKAKLNKCDDRNDDETIISCN